ncbi:N(5)-(carboxyethyl)ornithine synthase [Fundicoccus sp. Sow4_F4]|uniref:N(5)-(carboxyethyl)ornithine synthase n=1 Tax=Fundicoccus sp. Sow4_F4 TaxID=3438783 RepID=UPI003F8E8294
MKTMGFPISKKKNEQRIALFPQHIHNVKHPEYLYFEKNYGINLGFSDQDYIDAGANIVPREEVLTMDIICDPKIGDADYLNELNNQIIFGWVHAVQNRDITDSLIKRKLTAFAWEDMNYNGRHIFYRNNELAGEAALIHALPYYGEMLYNSRVAIIGNGNVAKGAYKILAMLGAEITSFNRRTESLLREEISKFDIVVNAILWDVNRKDHIIYKDDLSKMKRGSLIIDISCDRNGAIETSIPTTISEPTYTVDGILHYVVDHTPSIFFKTSSESISAAIQVYINELINGVYSKSLVDSLIIDRGIIMDERINMYQNR